MEILKKMKFEKVSIISMLFVLIIIALLIPNHTAATSSNYQISIHQRTARIDIKNFGDENNAVHVIKKSDGCFVSNPSWYSDETGIGTVINGSSGYVDFTVKCINDGKIKISLKGIDFRDKYDNSRRIPVCIEYTNFLVNGKTEFDKSKILWHDSPYFFEKSVKNGEEIVVHTEWQPFSAE